MWKMTELQMLRELERLFILSMDTKFLTEQQKDMLDTQFQEVLLHLRTNAATRNNGQSLTQIKWRNIK